MKNLFKNFQNLNRKRGIGNVVHWVYEKVDKEIAFFYLNLKTLFCPWKSLNIFCVKLHKPIVKYRPCYYIHKESSIFC